MRPKFQRDASFFVGVTEYARPLLRSFVAAFAVPAKIVSTAEPMRTPFSVDCCRLAPVTTIRLTCVSPLAAAAKSPLSASQ
jgi:hypothetical protein